LNPLNQTIFEFAPRERGAEDYRRLAEIVVEKTKNRNSKKKSEGDAAKGDGN